jgi:RND family efflux transporter MFP subunit
MKKKRILGIAVIVLIAVVLIAVRVKRMRQMENAPLLATAPLPVEVATVIRTNVVQTVHVLGTVIGADEAAVAPQVMARVLEVKVREGDRVQAGQLLAQLDPREFQDAVTSARAALAAAEKAEIAQRATTERDRKLYEVKAIALEQWQNSQAAAAATLAQVQAARARLEEARTQLGYCRITAPMDVLIARRLADPGDLAVPGKPLFEFVRQNTVRVRAELPPEDWTRLHVGQEVTLTWKGHALNAAVSRVFPAMNDSQLATIEVDLAQPPAGFISGATVGVDVAMNSAEGLAVPADALLEGNRGDWVFVVQNGAVRPVPVTVRARSYTRVVVTGDLAAGDAVVEAEPSRLMTLAAGMKVVEANQP